MSIATPREPDRSGLRDLQLKPEYRSGVDDLVHEFYLPCLERSQLYRRAVGYFTSAGLSAAAQGIVALLEGGGRMQLVASPLFAEDDLEAIGRGYAARDDVVTRALLRELQAVGDPVIRDRLGWLAWLVADDRLEIRVAIPIGERGATGPGIYHEKIGIFADGHENLVAFSGSPNETAGGLVANFESIDVFCSWDDPHGRTGRKATNFDRLWTNETAALLVLPFPEAARQQILTFRPPARPARELPHDPRDPDDPPTFAPDLWPHQIEAITAWEAAGRRGLISMATGSGKTRAALEAARHIPGLRLIVIAVPRSALVHQWAEEAARHTPFPPPILVHESAAVWQETLFGRLRASRHPAGPPVLVVGTLHSLAGQRFGSVLADAGVPRPALLIVDEVHNAGAPTFRRVLRDEFPLRLGLSATPARYFDEEGTSVIQQYFGETVYVYDLRQALADGHLCPYWYFVFPAHLSDDEYALYLELTRRITQLRGVAESDAVSFQTDNRLDADTGDVEQLLFRRARILKKCASKMAALDRALNEHPIERGLVYCADNEQLSDARLVLQRRQLVHLIYTAATPGEERQSALKSLGRGHVPLLLAIDCLDEGVDVPAVDQAVIIASSSNKRQFIQRRGRILRNAPGKNGATLVDIIALPPRGAGREARKILNGELARAKEMAELAENRHQALQHIRDYTSQYGVMLTELLSGEGNG